MSATAGLPALPPPPADNAPDAAWDAYLDLVEATTVKHVPLLLPIEAARDALGACTYVLSVVGFLDEPGLANLRAAVKHLHDAIQDRVDGDGRESFLDAVNDDPTATDEQRIYWLRVICAAQSREMARLRESRQ